MLAFAGLWEVWGRGEDRLYTCTVVTAPAVGALTEIHERMPLVLPPDRWAGVAGPGPGGRRGAGRAHPAGAGRGARAPPGEHRGEQRRQQRPRAGRPRGVGQRARRPAGPVLTRGGQPAVAEPAAGLGRRRRHVPVLRRGAGAGDRRAAADRALRRRHAADQHRGHRLRPRRHRDRRLDRRRRRRPHRPAPAARPADGGRRRAGGRRPAAGAVHRRAARPAPTRAACCCWPRSPSSCPAALLSAVPPMVVKLQLATLDRDRAGGRPALGHRHARRRSRPPSPPVSCWSPSCRAASSSSAPASS